MLRKLLGLIGDLLVAVYLLVLIGTGVCHYMNMDLYANVSNEMEPSIERGSLCIIDTTYDVATIDVDQTLLITTTNEDGEEESHIVRVVDATMDDNGSIDTVTVKSENVEEYLTTVPSGLNVEGDITYAVPKVGFAYRLIETNMRKAIGAVLALIIIIIEAVSLSKKDKKKQKKNSRLSRTLQ